MLTRAEKGTPTASRIKGKASIVRRLRALLIAAHRYGRGRARTAEDIQWSAVMLDALTAALAAAEAHPYAGVASSSGASTERGARRCDYVPHKAGGSTT
jgi:hypothetical protein